MRCANGGSGYTVPLRIKPERIEVTKDCCQSSRAKRNDIFDDDEPRRSLFDESAEFAPEAGARPGESCAGAEQTNVLAWESSANNIDIPQAIRLLNPQFSHVRKDGNIRPMLSEDGAAVWVNFTKGDGLHPRSFESKAKSSYTGKQV